MRFHWSIVVAMTLLSHAVIIALFLTVRALFHFEAIKYFTLFVVPIGAIMYGLLGSIGAGYALRWTQRAPTPPLLKLLTITAMVSFVVYLLIIAALTSEANGGHVGVLGSFFENITNTELVYGRAGRRDGSLGAVGSWGFLLFGLELAGVAAGAFVSYEGMLSRFRRDSDPL